MVESKTIRNISPNYKLKTLLLNKKSLKIMANKDCISETRQNLQKAVIGGENICAILCEIFILHRRQLPYDEEWLLNTARRKDWLKPEGTPLYCLGNLLAYSGMFVSRKYNSTIEDIRLALNKDNDVVVGVDREKLYAEDVDLEDLTNHAVVVKHIEDNAVTVFDPYEEPYISSLYQTSSMPGRSLKTI